PDFFFPASSSGRYRNAYEQTRGWIAIGLADTDQMLRATALRGGIFHGRFDLDRTERALAACDECPAHERRVYRGWTYLSWVDETGPDTGAPFSLETLGNLAIRDGYAIHS